MYFSKIPNIEYDKKPIQFPISETEFVLAKNFFKKFKIADTIYKSSIYFNKYAIVDGDRYDIISNKFYGTPDYDWIIILSNNIIDPQKDFPMTNRQVLEYVNEKYSNPNDIHHYETLEVKTSSGIIIQKEGIVVDEAFYQRKSTVPSGITGERKTQYENLIFKYYDNGVIVKKNGEDISRPVTNTEFEIEQNERKREIYILRPEYVSTIISELESQLEYKQSASYIDINTKRSGV